jgi:phosphatidylserine/phosphatidylglycerophosphate/cardiolipin synthase-like enzyme
MLRKACAVLTASLVLVTTFAGAASAYTPEPGPIFNNPRGNTAAKDRIIKHLVDTINSTPKYSVIRIAAYSNDRPDVVDALIAAHRRGVDVQMVLNDNWTSGATNRLVKVVGRDTNRRSFIAICQGSCRGGAGNQHMKFYLFSKAGKAKDVVMVGSANTTGYGARTQWNDMYTATGQPELRDLYTKIFEQLVRDRKLADPHVRRTTGIYESEFYPHYDTTEANDPVMARLNAVRCVATGGTGNNGHTVIRIVMYGWRAERGLYLAQKVAALDQAGCDVRVLVSSPGRKIVGTLRRGGVLIRSADLDLDDDKDTGFGGTPYEVFTHQKYMALSGSFRNSMGHQVWTGSENWSGMGMINDEVTIRIPKRGAYTKYVTNFNYVWANYSRSLEPSS